MRRQIQSVNRRWAIQHSRRQRKLKIFLIVFFVLVFFSFSFWLLFFSPVFSISQIKITGEESDKLLPLEQSVNQFLKERSLSFFPLWLRLYLLKEPALNQKLNIKNLVFFSRPRLTNFLLTLYPDLSEVKSSINWQRNAGWQLNINLSKRQPAALWCQLKACYLLDKEGIIYQPFNNGDESLLIFNDLSNQSLVLKQKVMSASVLAQILEMASFLKEKGIGVKEIVIKNPASQSLYFLTAPGWQLILDKNFQAPAMAKIITELINQKKIPDFKSLKYIDLRYPGRVIYQ